MRLALMLTLVTATAHADLASVGSDVGPYVPTGDQDDRRDGWRPLYDVGAAVCAAFDTEVTDESDRRSMMRHGTPAKIASGPLTSLGNNHLFEREMFYNVRRDDGAVVLAPASALTRACVRGDVDGDGHEDVVTLYCDAHHRLRLNAQLGKTTRAAQIFRDDRLQGLVGSWRLFAKTVAGVPLLEVERSLLTPPKYGSMRIQRAYVRFDGAIRTVLEVEDYEDAKRFTRVLTNFDPRRKSVTIRRRRADKTSASQDVYAPDQVEERYAGADGVYR